MLSAGEVDADEAMLGGRRPGDARRDPQRPPPTPAELQEPEAAEPADSQLAKSEATGLPVSERGEDPPQSKPAAGVVVKVSGASTLAAARSGRPGGSPNGWQTAQEASGTATAANAALWTGKWSNSATVFFS